MPLKSVYAVQKGWLTIVLRYGVILSSAIVMKGYHGAKYSVAFEKGR